MKKIILTGVLMVLACATMFAQETTVSEIRQKEIETAIQKASGNIRSLECDFTQEKEVSILETTMISTGHMSYLEGKLCWEYIEPYSYSFVMNGDKVMVVNEAGSNVIDVRSNKMFRKLSEIIIGGIDGSGIGDTGSFETSYFESGDIVIVKMIPRQREMKGLFSEIELHFSSKDYMVVKIVLGEASGDNSEITLSDRKLNQPVDEKVFDIP